MGGAYRRLPRVSLFAFGADQILEAALKGLGKTPVIEQLHLDLHRLFSAARRAALPAADAGTVLSALRLAGVTVLLIR